MAHSKQDIDALVEAMPGLGGLNIVCDIENLRTGLYLAAGLNGDGSEKAKVVRSFLCDEDGYTLKKGTWDGTTFTPDKEER